MQQDKSRTDRTYDDGGSGEEVTDDQLETFKGEVSEIAKDVGQKIRDRRTYSEDIRYNRWDGQSPDGRRYDKNMPKKDDGSPGSAFPFNGAPDERNRLADGVVNYKKARLVIALIRALRNAVITGNDLQDAGFAADMGRVLKWLVRSQWGAKFIREIQLAADAMLSDSPGGVVVGMFMRQEDALEDVEISPVALAQHLVENGLIDPQDQDALAEMMLVIQDREREAEAMEMLQGAFDHITTKRARRMVRELREEGSTNYPQKVPAVNRPEPRVMRLYEDVFFAKDAMDLERENVYVQEWLDPVDLRARVVTHDYDQDVVDELLGEGEYADHDGKSSGSHAGKSGFFEIDGDDTAVAGDASQENDIRKKLNTKRVEVITVYFRASNEDNVPAFYQLPFSCFVERPLKEREISYKIGRFPGVFFSREVLTKYLLDSRGLPEVLMTDQGLLKMFSDLFGAGAQLKTLPPLGVSPLRGAVGSVTLGPLVNVKRKKPSDIEPIPLGEFPREAVEHIASIFRRVCWYTGTPHPEVPPEIGRLLDELMLVSWLWNWAELFKMALQHVQEYFTDEQLQRITDTNGIRVQRSMEEITGQFDLVLNFSADDFDMELNIKRAELMSQAMAQDTEQTVRRSQYVRLIFSLAAPEWADQLLTPEEQASMREIDDEEMIFTKIVAGGVEPRLDEDPKAKNYKLRLNWLQNQMDTNPAWQTAPDINRQILMNHVQNYAQMVTQNDNAAIGRAGTDSVLG